MTRKKKSNKEVEGAEYGVDSRYFSKKERQADGKALMEQRLRRMKNVSEDRNFFTEFLTSYIDTIYSRRTHFAKDINITPVRLSQVLNNHREPKDEFMLRLMIHSEKTFKNVCEFHKKTWYQVYFHEKICDTMSSQDEWRPNIEKHVNISKLIKA